MADNMLLPPPTSIDVARRAGVSQSAVSLVFGGKAAGRVGKQAQEAILQAARELGYRPNRAARTLRSGRSRLVALAIPDVSNPYFAAVLQGAEQAARAHGYSVMLAQVRDEQDWQHMVLDALTSRAVDGFLLCTVQPPTTSEQLALRGKAVVVDAGSHVLPSLQLDIAAGMYAAMTHLLHLGHTKIAHLAASVDAETFHLRHRAYLDALRRAGCPQTLAYQVQALFTIPDAYRAARQVLTCSEPPSAIICDSDVLAVGVYKAAKDLGRAIPQDVSVASFDDSVIARILDPELTTVAIPARAIGEQAFLLLLRALEEDHVPTPIMVPLELMIRASTTGIGSTSEGGNEKEQTFSRKKGESMRSHLLIDADDTLWENNIYFEQAIHAFIAFLNHSSLTAEEVRAVLDEVERLMGYGSANFTRSLVETYCRLAEKDLQDEDIQQVRQFGEQIRSHPLQLLNGVKETLTYLAPRHDLVLLTKGDVEEQKLKVERSGIEQCFRQVIIVAEKDVATYHRVTRELRIDPKYTWMVGNSPRSDINPALAARLNAVYIPHPHTWRLEHEEVENIGEGQLLTLSAFADLRAYF